MLQEPYSKRFEIASSRKNFFVQKQTKQPNKLKNPQIKGLFLRGPVPLNWLNAAGKIRGKAMHVGIGIWLLFGMSKSDVLHLSPKIMRDLGVSRQSMYQALKNLENAKLIHCERKQGKCASIRILSVNDIEESSVPVKTVIDF